MGELKKSMLVALNDSISSRAVVSYMVELAINPENWDIYLIHFFRKSSASEELMGKKLIVDQKIVCRQFSKNKECIHDQCPLWPS